MTLNKSSVSYKDGLGNVTLATTNFTNPTNSNPQDSVNVTAAVVSSLLVTVVVIGIVMFFWCRRRIRRRRRREYIECKYNVQLLKLNTLMLIINCRSLWEFLTHLDITRYL